MAQGMPHLPRERTPFAFEDESTERIRLGLEGGHEERTVPRARPVSHAKWIVAASLILVVAAVAVLVVLGIL